MHSISTPRRTAQALALALLAGTATLASADTLSLSQGSSGWVSNYDRTSLDPTTHYGSMPPIETSGAAFEAANAGWQTQAYNDAAWATYTGGWVPGDGSHSPMYLRKTFTIGTPTASTFFIQVDDDSIVWVNGVLVPALYDASHGSGPGLSADITSFLHAGSNLIAIKADNSPGGGYAIAFSGSVDFTPLSSVPEPGTLAMFGLSLLALGVAKRRRA